MNTREFVSFIRSQELSYNHDGKQIFHKEGRKILKRIAQKMGLEKGSYEIRSNMGGIAVSGEVTLHGENIYIQLEQGRSLDGFMYRQCSGRKDYCGHTNHWMKWEDIIDMDKAVKEFQRVSEKG